MWFAFASYDNGTVLVGRPTGYHSFDAMYKSMLGVFSENLSIRKPEYISVFNTESLESGQFELE